MRSSGWIPGPQREARASLPHPMTNSSSGRASALARVKTLSPLFALAIVCAVPLLFPGDAPFINDEPMLIANAFFANQQHELAQLGLQGTRGYSYGPLPTWAYQAFLVFSRDLCLLVLVRALVVTALTALSLAWLSRTAKLWPWFAIAIMLSPYLWYYSRALWDNSFCIPVAALAFAAYVAFLEHETLSSFALVIASLWVLTLIHLMSVALTLPIALHMIIARRGALWRYKWATIAVSAVAVAAAYPYWSNLFGASGSGVRHQTPRAWLFPLLAARYFSATGLDYFFGADFAPTGVVGWLARSCSWISTIAYPLVAGGVALAVSSVRRAVRQGRFKAREHAAGLALGVLATEIVLSGVTRTYGHPHYYNATWIAFALFAWLSADWLAARARATVVCAPYAGALVASLLLIVSSIRRNGGTRERYGPTLANQMQVAAELARYQRATPLRFDVLNYQLFPDALATLRLLLPEQVGEPRHATGLAIVYASSNQTDARIRLIED